MKAAQKAIKESSVQKALGPEEVFGVPILAFAVRFAYTEKSGGIADKSEQALLQV